MKAKLTISLLTLLTALFLSCQQQKEEPGPQVEQQYLQLVMSYSDGSFERTRIIPIKYDKNTGKQLRTEGNISVSGTTTIAPGSFGVIEVSGAADITIDGSVTAGNLNINNQGNQEVKITITNSGSFTLSSSLNMNGKVTVINHGYLSTGGGEMQNGPNDFFNYGTHVVNGDLQVTNAASTYNNCGTLNITANLNLHAGRYVACNCGKVKTVAASINGTDKVEGKGFIEVMGNLNLNGHLTKSPDITLCYPGPINDQTKVGAAKLSCTNDCKPTGLPLRFTDLKIITSTDDKGYVRALLSLIVMENNGILKVEAIISPDGKTWHTAFKEDPSAFIVGQKYERYFNLTGE